MGGTAYVFVDDPAPEPAPVVPVVPTPAPAPSPLPLPPIPVPQSADVAKIKHALDLILSVAATAVSLTPTEIDNQILGVIQQVAGQPWFPEIVGVLLNMTGAQRLCFMQSLGTKVAKQMKPV
jgi:hypothetical protein